MEYLEKEDIILINRLTLKRHGGHFVPPFNLLNEANLDYLIEAVKSEIYGKELYSSIAEKASLYVFSIISNHVFQDGNKRTGLEAGLLFLKLNGYVLKPELVEITDPVEDEIVPKREKESNEILYDFIIGIASGKIDRESCKNWIEKNIKEG